MSNEFDRNNHKRVGNLNGKWSFLFRLVLATYPVVLAWSVWVTKETFANYNFRTQGDRFTAKEAADMRTEFHEDLGVLKDDLYIQMSTLPPPDWKARIIALESRQAEMATNVAELKIITSENKRILEKVDAWLTKNPKNN